MTKEYSPVRTQSPLAPARRGARRAATVLTPLVACLAAAAPAAAVPAVSSVTGRVERGEGLAGSRFTVKLPGFGTARVAVTGSEESAASPGTVLFKADVSVPRSARKRLPFSGSGAVMRKNGGLVLDLYVSLADVRGGVRHFKVTSGEGRRGAAGVGVRVISAPARAARTGCGHDLSAEPLASSSPPDPAAPRAAFRSGASTALASMPLLEVGLEGDGISTGDMASVMNAVDTIYTEQLGIKTSVKTAYTRPPGGYSDYRSGAILDTFTSRSNREGKFGSVDTRVLFTDNSIGSGILGIAWVSTVCASPAQANAVVRRTNGAVTPITTAHEIGHNLSATHQQGIMGAAYTGGTPRFTDFTRQQVSSFISRYGSCLSGGPSGGATGSPTPRPGNTPPPSPSPADPGGDGPTLNAVVRGTTVRGTMTMSGPSCGVRLMVGTGTGGRFAAVTTAVRSTSAPRSFSFTARLPGRVKGEEDGVLVGTERCGSGATKRTGYVVFDAGKVSSSSSYPAREWVSRFARTFRARRAR